MRYVPFDQKLAPNKWVYVGFFVVFAVLYGLTNPPVSMSKTVTASQACYAAQEFVEDGLKAPSTATFAPCRAPDSVITQGSGGSWTVHSWVDAQNGFGAMIRNDFTVELTYYRSADSWTLTDLQMAGH